jgi:hypothetical protein
MSGVQEHLDIRYDRGAGAPRINRSRLVPPRSLLGESLVEPASLCCPPDPVLERQTESSGPHEQKLKLAHKLILIACSYSS